MITAQEAREEALRHRTPEPTLDELLAEAEVNIRQAMSEGKLSIEAHFAGRDMMPLINALEEQGFTIYRNGYGNYTIDWELERRAPGRAFAPPGKSPGH